jgi:hypothetical protein
MEPIWEIRRRLTRCMQSWQLQQPAESNPITRREFESHVFSLPPPPHI